MLIKTTDGREAEYSFTDEDKKEAIKKMCEEWKEKEKTILQTINISNNGFHTDAIYCLYLKKFDFNGKRNSPIAVWRITSGQPTTAVIIAKTKEDRKNLEMTFLVNIKKYL
jgi:hypothetical protein